MRPGVGGQQRAKAPDEAALVHVLPGQRQFAASDALIVQNADLPPFAAEIARLLHRQHLHPSGAGQLVQLLAQGILGRRQKINRK